MGLSITPTDDTVMAAVRTLLLAVLPAGWEVFKGQSNRVPEPAGANFVVMTSKQRVRMSTNVDTWTGANPSTVEIMHDVQISIQLDIHGPLGTDAAGIIAAIMRDTWAVDQLAGTGLVPLFATDGNQMPFLNAEQQYEDRWVTEVDFQIVPTVSTPAQFAVTLTPTIFPVA